jgi:hypothetical protein
MVSPMLAQACQSDAKRVPNARQSDAKRVYTAYITCTEIIGILVRSPLPGCAS